jgi:hypothetical protein
MKPSDDLLEQHVILLEKLRFIRAAGYFIQNDFNFL